MYLIQVFIILVLKVNFHFYQIKMYKSDYLTINGKNLDRAAQEIDVEVLIGAESCNVTSLSRSQLTCRPPKEQPAPINNNDLPLVVVSVFNLLSLNIPVVFGDV